VRWTYLPSLLWGVYILVLPVLLHWEEALGIFMQMMEPLSDAPGSEVNTAARSTWQYAGMALLGGAYLGSLFFTERQHLGWYLLQFALVSAWYLLTPLLFGFVVVFCLWHSLQSLRHQMQHQHAAHGWSAVRFLKAMLPFGLAALGGFAAYVWWRGFYIGEAFILLSLITLPHVVVMHKLYATGQTQ
jgi:Brp/Blh family beta-carotene 15,15'-monooxygenase